MYIEHWKIVFKKSIHKFIVKYLDTKNILHFHKTPLNKNMLLLHRTLTFSYISQANLNEYYQQHCSIIMIG